MYYTSALWGLLPTMDLSEGICDYTLTRQALVEAEKFKEVVLLDQVFRPVLDELQRRRYVSIGQDFGQLMTRKKD